MTMYTPFLFTSIEQAEKAIVMDATAGKTLNVEGKEIPIFCVLLLGGPAFEGAFAVPEIRRDRRYLDCDDESIQGWYSYVESSGDFEGKIRITLRKASELLR